MKFGLTPSEYEYIRKTVVTPLEAEKAVVYCFGSRARQDHKPFSDLDLMIESPVDHSATISKIQEVLTNGNFPYKVDLVQLHELANHYRAGYEKDKKRFH